MHTRTLCQLVIRNRLVGKFCIQNLMRNSKAKPKLYWNVPLAFSWEFKVMDKLLLRFLWLWLMSAGKLRSSLISRINKIYKILQECSKYCSSYLLTKPIIWIYRFTNCLVFQFNKNRFTNNVRFRVYLPASLSSCLEILFHPKGTIIILYSLLN